MLNSYKRGDIMKKKIAFSLDEDLVNRLKKVSEETMIPQSRLIEKALKNVISEFEKELK